MENFARRSGKFSVTSFGMIARRMKSMHISQNEVDAHLARGNDVTGGSAGSDDDDDDDDGETMDPKYYSRTK